MRNILTVFLLAALLLDNSVLQQTVSVESSAYAAETAPNTPATDPASDTRGLTLVEKNRDNSKRVALVIGNSKYGSSPLKNPANDAHVIAASLRRLGFEVEEKIDLGYLEMNKIVESFGKKLRNGGVGLFYYAGHGMQVNGANYLIPVDAQIDDENEVRFKAIDTGLVLAKMEQARSEVNIVILDACRDNPFARSFRSANRGLANMDAPNGTFIAYATAPGKTAADGSGKNGLYTSELVKVLETPGISLEQVFKRTLKAVREKSGNKQTPWVSSNLEGEFFFLYPSGSLPKPEPASIPTARPPVQRKNAPEVSRIRNISTGLKGNKLILSYDLNIPGETYADVVLTVEIDGNVLNAGKLAIQGDIGTVPVGREKKITWDILKDMPSGYEGEVLWHLDVKGNTKSSDPFNLFASKPYSVKVLDKTILDSDSQMMWARKVEFGSLTSFEQAEAAVDELNSAEYAGYNDWRIPSRNDWNRLIKLLSAKYGYPQGSQIVGGLKKIGFTGIASGYYWASDILEREYMEATTVSKSDRTPIKRPVEPLRPATPIHSNIRPLPQSRTVITPPALPQPSTTTGRGGPKTRVDMTDRDNAVISFSDGYIYKKQLTTEKAFLLPVRSFSTKQTVKTPVRILPE